MNMVSLSDIARFLNAGVKDGDDNGLYESIEFNKYFINQILNIEQEDP